MLELKSKLLFSHKTKRIETIEGKLKIVKITFSIYIQGVPEK